MKRWLLFLFLFAAPAFLTGFAVGQAPPREHAEIRVFGKYTLVIQEAPFTLSAPAGGDLYFWKLPASWMTTDQNDSIVVTAAPEGAYSISCTVITIQWEAKKTTKATYALSLAVGKAPKPPDPTPVPPIPDPPIPPAPIKGMRVLFVWEKDDLLTREQLNVLNSTSIRDYLNKKCVDGSKGWAKWDKDTTLTTRPAPWPDLWAAVKAKVLTEQVKLPAVAVADGTKVTLHQLPATEAATLTLLKQYGGE